ncbi:MAG: hypothetical protein WC376_01500 [Candidatus Nanoarchaeia archaeon]|jgi:hypothetical protein
MNEKLKQFFQPWELKLIEIIEEAKKEKTKKIKLKLKIHYWNKLN